MKYIENHFCGKVSARIGISAVWKTSEGPSHRAGASIAWGFGTLYNSPMKRSGLPPLWTVIVVLLAIGITEIALRVIASPSGLLLGDIALLLWGIALFSGGLFSLSSYFFETKWRGFQGLIWVYKTIIPVGGKINAILFGIIGILIGILSIFRVLSTHFLLLPLFLSSISFDNRSISSGLVL